MTSKVDTIMDHVLDLLDFLVTTGTNAERDRAFAQNQEKLPSLNILFGDDEALTTLTQGLVDWQLELIIESYVLAVDGFGEAINDIRKEVHAALMADTTLGGLVTDVEPVRASRPTIVDGEKKLASQEIIFYIYHRTSRADINA